MLWPYHAWTYDLDGSLRGAPGFREHTVPPADHGLVELPLESWHGSCSSTAPGPPPFAEHVGALNDLVAPYRRERLVRWSATYDLDRTEGDPRDYHER